MRMVFRAVLFDLDGTLLDTLRDMADSVNIALARLGLPLHEPEAYKYFVGNGRREMAIRALPAQCRDEATLTRLLADISDEYSRRWRQNTRPYPGIPELLDALTTRGIRMAVLSNKPHDYTEAMVSELLRNWVFDFVVGESPERPRKPDPTVALHIVEQMRLEPEKCLYVGDSSVDMETAIAARLYPVGALWGFRTKDELLSSGARALARHPGDIIRFLES